MSKNTSFPRFWNMANVNGDTAEITLYGDVVPVRPTDWWTGEAVPGQFICPEEFAADLAVIKDKSVINIKINSVGGDFYTGLAIHNALKALPGQKNVTVEGIAASAASVIAMSGDNIKMYPGSLLMIHGIAALICDYVQVGDLKKIIEGMDASERAMTAIYAGKTGINENTLREMLEAETWMTGAEAVEKGFADEVIEGASTQMALNAKEHLLLVNGVKHNIDGLQIPARFNIPQLAAAPAVVNNPQSPTKGEEKNMTLDELKAQAPELVTEIQNAAVTAERQRIREIEEIQAAIDPALVDKAKYSEPTNAATLALEAMKAQQAKGAAYVNARASETAPAAAVAATPARAETTEAVAAATKEEEAQAIKNLAGLYNKIYK